MSKRISFLMLVVVMGFSMVGCNKTTTETAGTTVTATEEVKKENVTLSILPLRSNSYGLQEGWWIDILKDEVGVDLEIVPGGEEKLQAFMAGGELPDVVVFNNPQQVENAIGARLILNLDDYKDQLPNVYKNAAQAIQFARDKTSDGKAYAIPSVIGPGAIGKELNWGPYLRYDLYKKAGAPKIETLEDYLTVLKAMQDLEPETADGQKTYGLSLWADWDGSAMFLASTMSSMFGYSGDQLVSQLPFMELNFATGTSTSILDANSAYMKVIKFYYTANQMGLLDPDSVTQKFDAAFEKFNQGRIFFSWYSWLVGGYNVDANVNAEEPKGYALVSSTDAKPMWWGENPIGMDFSFAISSNTKNLDAALAYVDYMYSIEGLFKLNNGPQGIAWDLDESGKPYITDAGWDIISNNLDLPGGGKINDGIDIINSEGLSGATIHPTYNVPLSKKLWDTTISYAPTKLEQQWTQDNGYDYSSAYFKGENKFVMTDVAFSFVPTKGDDIIELVARIGDVVKSYSWALVLADDDAAYDELYNKMVRDVEILGIQDVLDWDAQAWEEAKTKASTYKK